MLHPPGSDHQYRSTMKGLTWNQSEQTSTPDAGTPSKGRHVPCTSVYTDAGPQQRVDAFAVKEQTQQRSNSACDADYPSTHEDSYKSTFQKYLRRSFSTSGVKTSTKWLQNVLGQINAHIFIHRSHLHERSLIILAHANTLSPRSLFSSCHRPSMVSKRHQGPHMALRHRNTVQSAAHVWHGGAACNCMGFCASPMPTALW